jgi:hypothetical protein
MTASAIFLNRTGKQCLCGAEKKTRQPFCPVHFFALPQGTREALFDLDVYPDTFLRACGLLGISTESEVVA